MTAERRRELVEEVIQERSRAVVELGVEDDEPPPSSALWPVGLLRLVALARAAAGDIRRRHVRSIVVVAIAWLEAIDDAK